MATVVAMVVLKALAISALCIGILYLVLAALVLRVDFRRTANRAMSVYLGALGLRAVVRGIAGFFEEDSPQWAYYGRVDDHPSLLAWLAACALLLNYPAPASWLPRWLRGLTPFVVLWVALEAVMLVVPSWRESGDWPPLAVAQSILSILARGVVPILLVAVALRIPATATGRVLLALGLFGYAPSIAQFASAILRGYFDGVWSAGSFSALEEMGGRLLLAFYPMLAAAFVTLLFFVARHRRGSTRRVAVAGLTVLAIVTVLYVAAAMANLGEWDFVLFVGILLQLYSAGFLTAAILKDEVVGFGGKLRLTVRASTVGAVFVAAFFAASELAQQLVGERWGPATGIAAAAGLVFVLAPLQQFATRVADLTLGPAPNPHAVVTRSPSERAYVEAVRFTLKDRAMSRTEEMHLADLAERLAIPAGTALRLRLQVQDEMSSASF